MQFPVAFSRLSADAGRLNNIYTGLLVVLVPMFLRPTKSHTLIAAVLTICSCAYISALVFTRAKSYEMVR